MITNADKEVLSETYRNCTMAVETIYGILRKVEDEDLALDLNQQVCRYIKVSDQAEDELLKAGHWPPDYALSKIALRAGILKNTRKDTGSSNIADILIQENTKGIVDLMRVLNNNRTAKKSYCEMAEELIVFEENIIERMKEYL